MSEKVQGSGEEQRAAEWKYKILHYITRLGFMD